MKRYNATVWFSVDDHFDRVLWARDFSHAVKLVEDEVRLKNKEIDFIEIGLDVDEEDWTPEAA